jgi:hypothetical protein
MAAGPPDGADLLRLHRRLHAFDIRSPLNSSALSAVAPAELRRSLAAARQAGLLDDGPGWTLKAGAARSLAQDLARTMDRAMDADRLLTDALLKRRHSS